MRVSFIIHQSAVLSAATNQCNMILRFSTNCRTPPKKSERIYGRWSRTLYSINQSSESVSITSRHHASQSAYRKTYHKQVGMQLVCLEYSLAATGTTVEVAGYLYNCLPERKSSDFDCEVRAIRRFLQSLAFMHCRVSVSLTDSVSRICHFQPCRTKNSIEAAKHLLSPSRNAAESVQVFDRSNSYFRIKGLTVAAEFQTKPFIYANYRPVVSAKIEKLVERHELDGRCLSFIINIKVEYLL